jgi:hypothetical protein
LIFASEIQVEIDHKRERRERRGERGEEREERRERRGERGERGARILSEKLIVDGFLFGGDDRDDATRGRGNCRGEVFLSK